jgi:hypothetical protein
MFLLLMLSASRSFSRGPPAVAWPHREKFAGVACVIAYAWTRGWSRVYQAMQTLVRLVIAAGIAFGLFMIYMVWEVPDIIRMRRRRRRVAIEQFTTKPPKGDGVAVPVEEADTAT